MLYMLHMLLLLPMLLLGQTLRLPTSGLMGLEGFEVLEGFVDLMMMMMVLGLRGHFQALEGFCQDTGTGTHPPRVLPAMIVLTHGFGSSDN